MPFWRLAINAFDPRTASRHARPARTANPQSVLVFIIMRVFEVLIAFAVRARPPPSINPESSNRPSSGPAFLLMTALSEVVFQ
jgi:hypothetical protein